MNKSIILSIVLAFSFFFLAFLFSTSLFIRPCSDDLFFYSEVNDKGWFSSIWELNTNIRFSGFLVFSAFASFSNDFITFCKSLYLYHFASFTLLVGGAFYFFKYLGKYFLLGEKDLLVFAFTILFLASFFFIGIKAQEIWFWTIANTIYLIPISLMMIAIPLIQKNNFTHNILYYLLVLIIGGMVENLVLSIVTCLIYLRMSNAFSETIKRKIIYSIIVLTVFPIISLLKKGISMRVEVEQSYKATNGYFSSLFSDFNLALNGDRIIFLLLIYLTIIALSFCYKDVFRIPKFDFIKLLKVNLLLIMIVMLCTFLPMIYIFGNFGPARSSMPFIFILNASMVFWSILIGQKIKINSLIAHTCATLSLFCMIIFFVKQLQLTSYFSQKYDERLALIVNSKEKDEEYLLLPKLPDSGVIPSQELNRVGESPAMTSFHLGRLLGKEKNIFIEP